MSAVQEIVKPDPDADESGAFRSAVVALGGFIHNGAGGTPQHQLQTTPAPSYLVATYNSAPGAQSSWRPNALTPWLYAPAPQTVLTASGHRSQLNAALLQSAEAAALSRRDSHSKHMQDGRHLQDSSAHAAKCIAGKCLTGQCWGTLLLGTDVHCAQQFTPGTNHFKSKVSAAPHSEPR